MNGPFLWSLFLCHFGGNLLCYLHRVALVRHQQQYRQPLQGAQVEQLQIVVPQFDLLAEDMGEKVVDVRKDTIDGLKRDRLVTVQEAVDLPAVVRVVGNRAEAVVFRNAGQIAFPVVLTQGLDIPRDKRLDAPAAAQRLPDPLVDSRSHAQVGLSLFTVLAGMAVSV